MCSYASAVEVHSFLEALQGLLVVSHHQLQVSKTSQGRAGGRLQFQSLLIQRLDQLQPLPNAQFKESLVLEVLCEASNALAIQSQVFDIWRLDYEIGESD